MDDSPSGPEISIESVTEQPPLSDPEGIAAEIKRRTHKNSIDEAERGEFSAIGNWTSCGIQPDERHG